MYEERREKFSFRSFFLTILLVLLFVFLMLWLFPTKWDVKNLQSNYDIERLSVLYDEIFANNVARMKDAAIGYFTNERMPQKVGESKKLTLREMYELHLVLKMKDKNGNACHVEKSYVQMTKFDEEYQLKVNLSCGDQEDYIIVYLGCYNYCNGGICEKKATTPAVKPTEQPKQEVKPQTKPQVKPEVKPQPVTPITKKYSYEYKLVTEDKTTCTGWSKWTKNEIKSTDNVKVETKTESEIVKYNEKKVQTGTKTEKVKTGTTVESFISHYTTELTIVDTKQVKVGTTTKEVTEKVKVGTIEKFVGIDRGTKVPDSTSTTIYKNPVSTDKIETCSYCNQETEYTWEIWSVEPVYDVVTKTVTVPVYKTVNVFEEKSVPVYDIRNVDVIEEKVTPVYKTVKIPVYEDIKYYREKTCTVTKGTTSIKWSTNKMDFDLIGKGYKLTGNVKEV